METDARAGVLAPIGSGGIQLPDGLRRRFEASLGTDLGGVRLHTGADADDFAVAHDARAVAVGQDIMFGGGESLDSDDGARVLAHEVIHTVQQRGAAPRAQSLLTTSQPGDAPEREAEVLAGPVLAGQRVQVSERAGLAVARVPGPRARNHQADAIALRLVTATHRDPSQLAMAIRRERGASMPELVEAVRRRYGHDLAERTFEVLRHQSDDVTPSRAEARQLEAEEALEAPPPSTADAPHEPIRGEVRDGRVRSRESGPELEIENERSIRGALSSSERSRPLETPQGGTRDERTDSASVGGGIEGGSIAASASAERRRVRSTAEGETVTGTTEAEVDLLEGSARVSHGSTTRHADGTTSGTSFGGGARLGPDGRLRSASADTTVTSRGGRSFTASGGIEVEIERPVRQPDGRWQISGTRTLQASGSAGQRSGRFSGSVSAGYANRQQFSRHFATETEAREFYDQAERYLGAAAAGQFSVPTSAAAAEQMQQGDSASDRDGGQLGAGVSASSGAVRVGVTLQAGRDHTVTVTRQSGHEVDVQIRDGRSATVGATASVPLTSMGATRGTSSHEAVTYRFDLSTAEGRAAFQRVRSTGSPGQPGDPGATGWRRVGAEAGESSTSGTSAGILIANLSHQEEVSETRSIGADGRRSTTITGTSSDSGSTPLPEFVAGAAGLRSASQATSLETSTTGGAEVSTTIEAQSAREAHQQLAQFTGTPTHLEGVSGESSSGTEEAGHWEVSADLTDAQLERFLQAALSGRVGRSAAGAARAAAVDALVEQLTAARGLSGPRRATAARRAIATFVAATGARGVEAIHSQLGERPRFDLALEGSDVFTGNQEVDRQVAAFEATLQAGGAELATVPGRIRELQMAQQTRLARMSNPERFRDVPPELRQQQMARVRELVAQLRALHARATTQAASVRRADAEVAAAPSPMCPAPEHRSASSAPEPPSGAAGHSDRARTAVARDSVTMEHVAQEARRVRDRVRGERGLHTGDAGVHSVRTATESLTSESGRYQRARESFQAAEQDMARAGEARVRYRRLADQLEATEGPLQGSGEQLARETRELIWEVARHYRAALAHYRTAFATYAAIRQHHAARRDLWGETPSPEAETESLLEA